MTYFPGTSNWLVYQIKYVWGEVTFSVGEGWEGRYPSCWLGICQSLKTPLQWNMELWWCSKRKQWKGILGARRENIGSIRNWTLLQNYFHAFWLLSTLHPNCCFHPSNIRILNFQNISSLNYKERVLFLTFPPDFQYKVEEKKNCSQPKLLFKKCSM